MPKLTKIASFFAIDRINWTFINANLKDNPDFKNYEHSLKNNSKNSSN